MTTSSFCQQTVEVDDRNFLIQLLKFDNGNFISISEGSPRIGAMVVSLSTNPTPVTTTVIPAKSEFLFLKLTAEKISTMTKGIAIVSSNVERALKPEMVKTLMNEIMGMIKNV